MQTVSPEHMPMLGMGFVVLLLFAVVGMGVVNYVSDKF